MNTDEVEVKNMIVRVPEELRHKARLIALKQRRSIQDVLRELVEKWVAEQEGKEAQDAK